MKRVFFLLLLCLLLFGCNSEPDKKSEAEVLAEGYKVLSGPEIQKLFTGNTIVGRNAKGTKYKMYFVDSENSVGFSGEVTDAGTWTVQGEQFCQTWENWRDGEKTCGRVAQKENHIYFLRDGYAASETTWYAGNHEGY